MAGAFLPAGLWASADISVNSPSVAEGDSGTVLLPFVVTRSGDTGNRVILQFQTDDNTATAPSDYVSIASTNLTIPAGATSAAINVTIQGDSTPEGDESFFLHLTSAVAVGPAPGFAAQQTFATGATPVSVATADVNTDGKPDVLVANHGANSISVLLNTTPAGAAVPAFAAQQPFATGMQARSVTAADINGDGRPDLIGANQAASSVSVLLNTTAPGAATPSFDAQQSFATGSNPYSVATTDVNGDGAPDVLVANNGSDTVSILLNTTAPGAATPSFATQQTFATGSGPISVAAADVNDDGRPDALLANTGANNVSVLLNTTAPGAATPSFATQQTFATGTAPTSVAAADVNGDGKPDLLTANATPATASVLLNTTAPGAATPSFASQQIFATGTNPQWVAAADVNTDGKTDLMAANLNSTVSVLLNISATGTAMPAFASQQTFATGSTTVSVATADINGDGRPDLVAANQGSSTVSVLLNTAPVGVSTPSFADQQTFATGFVPRSATAADINADGRPDVLAANNNSDTVSVLLNTTAAGAVTPSFASQQTFATGADPSSVAAADINGDGKSDLIVANQGSDTLSVLLNATAPGAATPSFATHETFVMGSNPTSVATADVNGDGKPDLVAADGGSTVSVLLNTTAPGAATPSFATHEPFALAFGSFPSSVTAADINGDGKPDLIAANSGTDNVSVLLNTAAPGAATPSFATHQAFGTGTGPVSVTAADVNGDGKPDLLVANHASSTVSVLLNTTAPGANTPSLATHAPFATGMNPRSVRAADVSGDGKPDVLVANENSDTVSVLLNTTAPGANTPSLATHAPFATGMSPFSVATADVNGGGTPDLIVANENSNAVSVLLNELFTTVLVDSEGQGTILEDDADVTPDAFAFTDQNNVAPSTVVTSNSITVSGISAAASIAISAGVGEYSIGGGAFTGAAGTVTNGQTVRVRHVSAATDNTATNTTLTIGGVSDTFTSITAAGGGGPDTTPNPFNFADQAGVDPNTLVTSGPITVSGIDSAAAIQITGPGQYSINGGAFTSAPGTVNNGAMVSVQVTSGTELVTVSATLDIGGVTDTFSVTTRPPTRAGGGGGGGGGGAFGVLLLLNLAMLGLLRRRLRCDPVVSPPARC